MSCENVQGLISLLLDRQLAGEERGMVLEHLSSCRACKVHFESAQKLRARMLRLGHAQVPPKLHTQLRVIASHAQQRRVRNSNIRALVRHWTSSVRLAFDNLMRPLALPFGGGALSAVMMFGMLMPSLSFPHDVKDQSQNLLTDPYGLVVWQSAAGEVLPPETANRPRIQRVTIYVAEDANVVELTIDAAGKVSDWSVTHGKMTEDIRNIIMLGRFEPATFLGVPTSGKVNAVQLNLGRHLRS
jgi:hypothetical protein